MENMKGEKLLSSWWCVNKIICKSALTFFCSYEVFGGGSKYSTQIFYYKFWWSADIFIQKLFFRDFPGGTVVKNPPANAGDTGSSPGLGGSHMLQSN